MAAPIVAGRTRRTRQIRATVTLLLALAFLGGAFYTAYSYIQNDARSPQAKASDGATGTVLVSSKNVASPVAIRYAWENNPTDLTLVNSAGLPLAPFRTDEW